MAKRAIVILISSVFFLESVFPNIDLSDFSRIPMLWSHLQSHKLESPGITLLEFLYLPYGDSGHVDQDRRSHERLPFSKRHQYSNILFATQEQFHVDVLTDGKSSTIAQGVIHSENPAGPIAELIWQPPKIWVVRRLIDAESLHDPSAMLINLLIQLFPQSYEDFHNYNGEPPVIHHTWMAEWFWTCKKTSNR